MSGAVAAGVAGTAALAVAVAAGALFYKGTEQLTASFGNWTGEIANISEKLAQAITKDPKVEVNVPEIKLRAAEAAMVGTCTAVNGLSGDVRDLTDTIQNWSNALWRSCVVLCASGVAYGVLVWPRKHVRNYIQRTLADEDSCLADEPPATAMMLLQLQTIDFGGLYYSPIAGEVQSMKLRRKGTKFGWTPVSYAIMYKTEDDAMWLLEHGVAPQFDNGSFHKAIQNRMYRVVDVLLQTLSRMAPDSAFYYVNEEIIGNTPLTALIDLPTGGQWNDADKAILESLRNLGATGQPVERTNADGQRLTITMETIVNSTFTDPVAKNDVLTFLQELQPETPGSAPVQVEDAPIVSQHPFSHVTQDTVSTPEPQPDTPPPLRHNLSDPPRESHVTPSNNRKRSGSAVVTSHPTATVATSPAPAVAKAPKVTAKAVASPKPIVVARVAATVSDRDVHSPTLSGNHDSWAEVENQDDDK